MMKKILLITLLAIITFSAPSKDKMTKIPGYGADYNTSIYAGYLDVSNPNRSLYYLFVQSVKGANNNDPVTLWLNGGPGCSSLLGFLQQIGPYYLEDGVDYKEGDKLTLNEYSWHKASNIIFLQSPAGVGFSYNLDTQFEYDDVITASDTMDALLDFFKKYPEYKNNKFFIAGQSYAGKYIPDLAVLIDKYNLKQQASNRINLVGLMVGNGVMSFQTLDQSTIEFIISKQLVDPEILSIYQKQCKKDLYSKECSVFLQKFDKDTQGVFFYDIYGYCYYDQNGAEQTMPKMPRLTQQSILAKLKKQLAEKKGSPHVKNLKQVSCGFFDYGTFHYFNIHNIDYHAKFQGQLWNGPCADNVTYEIDPAGSIDSYKYLLNYSSTARKYQIFLYNGNADAVVPAIDTYKGLEMLKVMRTSEYQPWFTGDQHSGFVQQYSGIQLVIFKGGSHQLPQSKRPQSYQFFKNIVSTFKDKPQGQLSIEEN